MSLPAETQTLPDDAPHVLVVDDDNRIRTLLARYLSGNGYRVTTAGNAAEARSKIDGIAFDCLILDVMMPGESGLDLARDLRTRSDLPIVLLTARGEPKDRIAGLEVGADDYVPKPFEPRELLLRIGALLRRTTAGRQTTSTLSGPVRFGPYIFLPERGELRRGEEAVRLTERERELLRLLAEAPDGTVSRLDLAATGEGGERAVDVQINRLRRKIEDDPANPLLIQTVRGVGYRLMMDR